MDRKYWLMLDGADKPLPNNAKHSGWSEIESYSVDHNEKSFLIDLGLSGPTAALAAVLDLNIRQGKSYQSVAVDMMSSDGKWMRNRFNNVQIISSIARGEGLHFTFEFERMQIQVITIHRR